MPAAFNPGGRKGNGKGINFLRSLIGHSGDACVTWPYSRDRHGRGLFGYMGNSCQAHRIMCILAHGEPPTPTHQAAHSCGKGHLGCVNPNHLSWKTGSENGLDRLGHGTHATNKTGSRTPLSEQQRNEIKSLEGRMPRIKIAARFGVSRQTVKRIIDGRQYKPPGSSYMAELRRKHKAIGRLRKRTDTAEARRT